MVDLDHLYNLMGGDENMVNKFLDIFKSETPRQLDQLYDFLDDENWEMLSTTAHSIKSQSKYLGLDRIADIAYTIEQDAERQQNLDGLEDLIGDLERALNGVLDNL